MRFERDARPVTSAESTRPIDRRWIAGLVAVLAVSALIRLVAPGAFPEVEADEGLWTNSAKNFVAFGDWFLDGRTHMLLSPLFHALSAALFSVVGPGIATARLVSGVAGLVSVVLLYLLVLRVDGRRHVALIASALFGINQFTALTSRRALIEPLELCMLLLAALLFARRSVPAAAAGGVAMALALLAKVNAAFFLIVMVAYAVSELRTDRTWNIVTRTAAFAVAAFAVAGLVYGVLYSSYPSEFVKAFTFELRGEHFAAASDALLRVGRFGLAPEQAGRTTLALFRESPFLLVLAALGTVVWLILRPRGAALFSVWLVVGLAYFLGQTFQPLRYFYLVTPPLAYFASLALVWIGAERVKDGGAARMVLAGALVITLGFELAYLGMNAVANRAGKIETVRTWVQANTRSPDRIMAAGYLCTDIPRTAYAHYHYAGTPDQLIANIEALEIDYVIVDSGEWRPELANAVAARFQPVQRWSFGAVYRVR